MRAKVVVRLAGPEVAKWAAGRRFGRGAPALGDRVAVIGCSASVVRDMYGSSRDVVHLDPDAEVSLLVGVSYPPGTRFARYVVAYAVREVELATRGLCSRADKMSVEVER